MKIKKRFHVLIFILLVSHASACALSSQPPPSPPPTVLPTLQPSPTMPSVEKLDPAGCEVHLWHAFSAEKEATLLALASAFQTNNPYGIRLRVEYHSPLHKEVWAAINARTPPDIVITSCDQVAEYAQANAVVSLAEYINNTQYGLSQKEQEDLWPIVLESGCRSVRTGQYLGLFFDANAVVMFYNTTWLQKLKTDTPPRTWEEFRERCNAARDKKNATWGYACTADGLVVVNWISSLGELLIDPHNGKALLDSPHAIAALSVLRDLIQDGCAYCTFDADTVRADFALEKVLFTFDSTANLPKYKQAILNPKTKKPQFTWSIAPLPHLTEEPVVSVQGSTMGILRTTPQQQLAAWLFVKWFLQRENDVQWALSCGALPLHKSNLEAPEMKDYFAQNPLYELACSWMAYAQTEPGVPKWTEVRELLVNAATMVCQGQAEPAEALTAADVAADRLLAR